MLIFSQLASGFKWRMLPWRSFVLKVLGLSLWCDEWLPGWQRTPSISWWWHWWWLRLCYYASWLTCRHWNQSLSILHRYFLVVHFGQCCSTRGCQRDRQSGFAETFRHGRAQLWGSCQVHGTGTCACHLQKCSCIACQLASWTDQYCLRTWRAVRWLDSGKNWCCLRAWRVPP